MTTEVSRSMSIKGILPVTVALAGLGALGGACLAIVMTTISTAVAGEPGIPGYVSYTFSAPVMAAVGAVVAPAVSWAFLRTVPIWRAVLEPTAAVATAAGVAMAAAPSTYLYLVPAAAVAASWLTRRRHHASRLIDGRSDNPLTHA